MIDAILLALLALTFAGAIVIARHAKPPCDHTPEPRRREGRIYLTCRCGERFLP